MLDTEEASSSFSQKPSPRFQTQAMQTQCSVTLHSYGFQPFIISSCKSIISLGLLSALEYQLLHSPTEFTNISIRFILLEFVFWGYGVGLESGISFSTDN